MFERAALNIVIARLKGFSHLMRMNMMLPAAKCVQYKLKTPSRQPPQQDLQCLTYAVEKHITLEHKCYRKFLKYGLRKEQTNPLDRYNLFLKVGYLNRLNNGK
jgi:hypothetical protein